MSTQPPSAAAKTSPEEAVHRVAAGRRAAPARDPQGDHRPGADDRGDADLPVRPRPLPDDRRARAGQDADRLHPGPGPAPEVQPHPVHARPDAQRHHRHRDHRGGRGHRQAVLPVRAGADLRQHRAGRRDQPHPAQDPGRAACRPCRSTRSPPARTPSSSKPPFFVMATQNPIEQEGTYPLPEAQLDRFMLSINIGYPDPRRGAADRQRHDPGRRRRRSEPILSGRDLLWIQQLVREVPASDHMVDYAVDLVRATRPKEPGAPTSSRTGWPGAPARGPRSTSSWPPRPGPSSTAASPSAPATSAPSSDPCCGTASSPTSTPTPRASTSTRSSTGSSRACAEPSYGEGGSGGDGAGRKGAAARAK